MKLDYHIPSRILFGAGKLANLATEPLPGKKALIVITDGGSMRKNGYLQNVVKLLAKQKVTCEIFDKVSPNPTLDQVTAGAGLAKKGKCDFVLGLGGGSAIDCAKAIAVMMKNSGNYWDYISGGSGKGKNVTKVAPIVAITTTAGTGTEADPWTVTTKTQSNEKIGYGVLPTINSPGTFPVLSIVDPELMLTVPPMLTAYQGFDAFFHAAEGVIANIATPISDMYALKSIELINQYLPTAIKNGKNLEARTNVALANTLSGMVESTSSCTSEHSLEHALSAHHPELPHGAGLIMLSIAYFSHFADVVPDCFDKMAKAMGKNPVASGSAKSAKTTVHPFIVALTELQKKCGVDKLKMSDYGITKAELPALVKNAFETMGGLFALDPKKLTYKDALAIVEKSFR